MKFPKLFGRKKGEDDEDEDDLEDEMFDLEDMDDLEGGAGADAEHSEAGDLGDDEEYEEVASNEPGVDEIDDLEEEMVGGDDVLEDPFEGTEDDLDDGDLDDGDLDDDDDFDEEDEREEAGAKRKALMFAAVGAGVLLLSGLGGAGYWFFSGDDTAHPEAAHNDPTQVEMSMPPPPSVDGSSGAPSLNQLAAMAPEATETAPVPAAAPETHSSSASAPVAPAASEPAAAEAPSAPSGQPGSMNSLNALGSASQAGGGVVIPAVSPVILARLPDQPSVADQSQALSSAPVRALIENVDGIGDLPKIAANGSHASTAYARPSDPGISLPKVAIMIEGVGLSRQASLAAINKLPPEVSLVLSPYGRDLDDWVFRARLAGHEVFLSLPMESDKFPLEDAGPLALDTQVQVAENKRRLSAVMASAGGYVGLVTYMGGQFLKAEGQIRELLKETKSRGLMFVIGGRRSRNDATQIAADLDLPRAETEFYIDETPSIQEIRTSLDRAVSLAKDRGSILVVARPYPVTIKSILDWVQTIPDAGIALVPASAVATKSQN